MRRVRKMKIETKYNIGDKVYIVEYRTIHKVKIEDVRIFSDKDDNYISYGISGSDLYFDEYREEDCFDNIIDAEKRLKEVEKVLEEKFLKGE